MKHKRTYLIALLAALAAGCSQAPKEPVVILAAVDVSGSSAERLDRYGAELYRLQRSVSPESRLLVSAFADTSIVIYEGPVIAGKNRFNQKVGSELMKASKVAGTGTRSDLAVERVAEQVVGTSKATFAVVLTDGGIEDTSAETVRRIQSATKDMCTAPKLDSVTIAGVLPEHRGQWTGWLRPLGTKASVQGLNDLDLLGGHGGVVR